MVMVMSSLPRSSVKQFRTQGYLAPIDALSSSEARDIRTKLEAYEAVSGVLAGPRSNSPHLLFTWVDELIRHSGILDAVESVIGRNILVRGSSFFIKEPHDLRFVSWHQDATYWGLEPLEVVTAWVAITESMEENGAMKVVPRSHLKEQIPHVETFSPNNMLSRGQEIAVAVNPDEAVTLELNPGQMSLHHVLLVHGSEPNPSAKRRVGIAIRYMPTHVRQTTPDPDFVTLVRGSDNYHHFPLADRPKSDLSAEAIAHHAEAMKARRVKANAISETHKGALATP